MTLPKLAGSKSVQVYQPDWTGTYSIEVAARIVQTTRHRIGLYCKLGLVDPVEDPQRAGWAFDDRGLWTLRRIEWLRQQFGMDLRAVKLVLELMDQVERLESELRFRRRGL